MRIRIACLSILGLVASNLPVRAETGVAPLPPAAPATAASPPAAPGATPWHLPASASSLKITGESGGFSWPLYVPGPSVSALKTFQLAFRAAIAVMPEASWITVTINGQTVGRAPIAAPMTVKTLALTLPPGVVQPGWNAVRIEVAQRHRVDCSIASTYELWTEIDPGRTGFVGTPPRIAGIADLPALPADEDGATRFHLMLPRDPPVADLGRAVRVIEEIAMRGHFTHPVVDLTPGRTGLHVAVGTAATLSTLPGLAGKAAPQQKTDPPFQIGTTADGSPLLTVSGASDDEVDRAVDALDSIGRDPIGTEEGLKALGRSNGMRLRPGASLSLAELGMPTRTFSGRLFHEGFEVLLPPDAYPADYGEARLSLDGGYAAGLTHDARLVVRVNGVIDGNLEFDRAGGAVLQGQIIHMPLDPFRPGRNRIDIEAQLPARSDQSCDTLNSIGAKERFLLLGTSTLSLPPLARVAQFPSLSATLAGNLRVTPKVPPRVFIPRATEGTIAAIATLLANAATTAGVHSGAVFARGTPQAGADPAIVVGSASDIPGALMTAVGVDAQAVASAWRSEGRAAPTDGAGDEARFGRPASDSARLDAWGERVDERGGWLGSSGSLLTTLSNRFAQSLRSAGLLGYPARPVTVTGDTAFVLAQGLIEGTPLTLITGRDDKALATGAAALVDPTRLADLDGRAATLDDNGLGATLTEARDTAFFRTQAFSFVNDRLIAAGWVSKHAAWYIGAALLATMLLGASTWACLTFGRPGPSS